MTSAVEATLAEMGITIADVGRPATVLAKFAQWYTTRNTEAFKRDRDELFRDWVVELHRGLADHLVRLDATEQLVGYALERLGRLVDDPEFCRVQANYGYEAAREAIDARRRMLSHAAAGSVRLDLSVAQLARVERTVRELDPADVRLLAELIGMGPHERPKPPVRGRGENELAETGHRVRLVPGEKRFKRCQESRPSGDILAAAGCIRLESPNAWDVGTVVYVTELGRWVVKVLDSFLRSLNPDDPTPPQRPQE